ncbi:tRNA 2-selenouridine(34) synthase MnmH [Cohnella endophytica]|uniref:tRNA 2-selenouridine(34) synthase MnmH n=1 Tax=Cohnella endophytica TaxID=2419778 RepID=A0A494YDH2_9BACL|nr:tRNA 2-selenouridine(34) synthase MnmH [Cohnella endophytica]RKP58065.1 tRNA 2-selenouridine(34) synthase MnmH [Cohnella endophytica]
MLQELSVQKLVAQRRAKEITLIDVRSPSEFEDSTIPGSLNIPLFDDGERAEIGTIYKQVSVEAAKQRGLEIVSAKLPAFINRFADIPGKKAVFCWRGGMRSKTSATLLSLMGIQADRLTGGYRAYRNWVVDTLGEMEFLPEAIVLHGNTGTGKTAVLRSLRERGYPVLDLEAYAGHRGSIFGKIGLKGHNQKTFDSLLVEELIELGDKPYILIEAESRRIGKVVVQEFLMSKKESGIHIVIEMPMAARVRHILEDYAPHEHPEDTLAAFKQIKSRIHTPVAAEIEACLQERNYAQAVELLIRFYYDPRYAHSFEQYDADRVSVVRATSVAQATDDVERLIGEYAEMKRRRP